MRQSYSSADFGSIDRPLEIEADFAQASSLICWRERPSDPWLGTPYQVGDVQHNPHTAIDVVAEWLDN